MKFLLGILLIVLGVAVGLYVGIWVCLIGGIAGLFNIVISLINGSTVNGLDVALDIVKIMFAGLAGYLSAVIFIIPGIAIVND